MPKLKAEKMSEAWDNKPRSKTRLQLQFSQREPVLSPHKSPPHNQRLLFQQLQTSELQRLQREVRFTRVTAKVTPTRT